ncbi:hypothetical protein KC968_02730 [Candidatus Saccharibacteria bacterium]|nr:hypothetical protein [Candidatus Saccharibacteria bacterium]
MFSNVLIGFLAGIGFGAWVFSKIQRQTGGNTTNSLVVAGGAGLVLFIAIVTLMALFVPSN